jgi:NADH dehydrogenase/NADH:ubiquinone oxidoreductase subunit G
LYLSGKPPGMGDDILRHRDKNPNAQGAMAVAGRVPLALRAVAQAIAAGQISHLVVLGADADSESAAEYLSGAKSVILLATHTGPLTAVATVLLPAATWAEGEGTYTNAAGLAQVAEPAIEPQGDAKPAWKLLAALSARLGDDLGWRRFDEVNSAMHAVRPKSVPPAGSERGAAVQS